MTTVNTRQRIIYDWVITIPATAAIRQVSGSTDVTIGLTHEDGVEIFDAMAKVLGAQHLSTLMAEMSAEAHLMEVERRRREKEDAQARDDRMNCPA